MTQTDEPVTTDPVARPAQTMGDVLARILSEVFAPTALSAVMPVTIAIHSTAPNMLAGLGWGLTTMLFSSVIPTGIVWWGVRRGELSDHHIGVREQRRTPMLLGLLSVLVGIAVLVIVGAPTDVLAMAVVMLVVLFGVGAVNLAWKLSAHTAVAAGSVGVLTLVFGPTLLALALLVAAIGWSRVRLRAHTIAQVLAGTFLGVVLAVLAFTAIA